VSADRQIVIVGAGLAGLQIAESLRAAGYAGAITLLGDEQHLPYHRPPLSKAWLAGEIGAEQLQMRAPEALARKNITLRTDCTVARIDAAAQTVALEGGELLRYSGLALTTGASPRALPLGGADAAGVLALRSRDDAGNIARRLAACVENAWPVVVIGGGFVGLEVAATARKKGLSVTVLEAAPRLLSRVLAPVLSDWYAALHRGHGVQLLLDARVQAIETVDALGSPPLLVRMRDGSAYPAGLVVVGIGVVANDRLARAAGIACERGIVVDACSRTSAPQVVAAGDCTARRLPDGSLLRLESVQNATEQGKSAAAALLGQERPLVATPWFWSDQYDKKLQTAGLSSGAEQWVVRGDMDGGSFSVFHLRGGRLLAVDSINATKDHLQARKLLDAGVSPTAAQAVDGEFDLSSLLSK
jgi:3-phenylpropionate/trans-cinnamate dioxygenase ferredoxin reductase subunit